MSIIKSKDTEQIRRAIPFIQANIELKELLEKGEIKSNKLSDEIVQKLKRYNFFPAQEYTSVQFDNNLSANEMKEWESAARYYCNPTSYIDELSGRFAHIFIDALMLKRAYVDEICYSCAKPTEIRLAALSFETIGDFNLITVYDGSTNTMYSLELNILLDNIEKGSSNIVFPSGKDKYFVCDTEEIINALGMLSVYKQGYIVLLGESFPPFNDKQEHNIVTLIEENVNMGHLSFATTICGLSVSRFERIKRWYDHFDSFASDSWGYFRTMATDPPLVHAPENCTVLKVEQDQEGLSVTIEGNNTTVYRNLKAVFVSPQQSLKKDQYIGLVDEILRHPDTLLEK